MTRSDLKTKDLSANLFVEGWGYESVVKFLGIPAKAAGKAVDVLAVGRNYLLRAG